MSEGNRRCSKIMAPISRIPRPIRLSSKLYNRLYEAVDLLPDKTATALVNALLDELEGRTGTWPVRSSND